MKRDQCTVLYILLAVFLMDATAKAQAVPQNPQERFIDLVGQIRAIAAPQAGEPLSIFNSQERGGARGGGPVAGNAPLYNRTLRAGGAWWTNTALVERLGLTDDQKTKIERAFENHRLTIVSTTGLLEKEEAQLARLLEAEPIDRNAILTQTDRVIQARGEMERANAAMTLEMREHLTRAQWMQLPQANANIRILQLPAFEGGSTRGRGGRGAPPAPSTTPTPTEPPPPPAPGPRRGRDQ
jgi:Spy/CpxP family protein refolding chaperone